MKTEKYPLGFRKRHYLYTTWESMRKRCNCVTHTDYKLYGARGIKVCKEWDEFWNFVRDMGDRPKEHSLDRIDNDKDYCDWYFDKGEESLREEIFHGIGGTK